MALTKKISDIIKEDTTGLLSKHHSWLRIELKDIAEVLNGFAFSSSHFNNDGIGLPLIRIRDVIKGHTTTYYNGNYEDIYLVNKNEILVGMDGDFNLGLWKSLPSLLNQRVCKISVKNDNYYDKQFLIYLLPPYLKAINDATSSITVKHLSSKTLSEILLPLPPLNEQKRIADKIDELFSELDNGIEELETAQKKLELYRQSLLKSAVEGELSKEWRETQTEISETGEQLLARILKERRERWEQEKLKEFAEKGKNPPKNWQEKYPEPVQPDTENLPQLPEGWVWAKLEQLTTIGTGVTPLKSKSEYYTNGNIPWVTSGALNEEFVGEASHYITELAVQECRLKLYPIGTLLVAMYGEGKTRGKCSELTIPATINQAIAALVFYNSALKVKDYIKSYLLSSYEDMRRQAAGGVQPNLNLQIIGNLDIPLPPFSEQLFINEKLENSINLIENQSSNLKASLTLLNTQKRNILTAAFKGELVPQDPNDEPAQVLLKRIQQQREAEALVKKSSPKKRSTSKAKKEVGMSRSILEILQQQSDWISGQDLASAFGLSNNSEIENIEKFYEELRTLSLNDKIVIKPDCESKKEQDLIKLKDKTDAS